MELRRSVNTGDIHAYLRIDIPTYFPSTERVLSSTYSTNKEILLPRFSTYYKYLDSVIQPARFIASHTGHK